MAHRLQRRTYRPDVEILEDRTLLSGGKVTTDVAGPFDILWNLAQQPDGKGR